VWGGSYFIYRLMDINKGIEESSCEAIVKGKRIPYYI
jgi:hypothetical protein